MGKALRGRARAAAVALAWVGVACVPASAARADVSIDAERVVVRTPSMSATVTRSTEQVRFADALGAPLLSQMPLRGVPRRLVGVEPRVLGYEALRDRGVAPLERLPWLVRCGSNPLG